MKNFKMFETENKKVDFNEESLRKFIYEEISNNIYIENIGCVGDSDTPSYALDDRDVNEVTDRIVKEVKKIIKTL